MCVCVVYSCHVFLETCFVVSSRTHRTHPFFTVVHHRVIILPEKPKVKLRFLLIIICAIYTYEGTLHTHTRMFVIYCVYNWNGWYTQENCFLHKVLFVFSSFRVCATQLEVYTHTPAYYSNKMFCQAQYNVMNLL